MRYQILLDKITFGCLWTSNCNWSKSVILDVHHTRACAIISQHEQAQKALCTILDLGLDKSALDCQAGGDPRLLSMTMITYSHTHLYSASGRRGHPKARVLCSKFFGFMLFLTTSLDCTHQETRMPITKALLSGLEIANISISCIMVSSAYFWNASIICLSSPPTIHRQVSVVDEEIRQWETCDSASQQLGTCQCFVIGYTGQGTKMTFSFHISCQAKGQSLARYLYPQWWRHIIAVDLTHYTSHETTDFFLKPPLRAGPCTRVVMPWGSQEVHKIPPPFSCLDDQRTRYFLDQGAFWRRR